MEHLSGSNLIYLYGRCFADDRLPDNLAQFGYEPVFCPTADRLREEINRRFPSVLLAVLTGAAVAFLLLAVVSCVFAAEGRTVVPLMYSCPLTAKLRITQQFEFVDVPEGWRAFGTSASNIETAWQFDHISSAGRIFCVYRREVAGGTETRHVYERDWPQGYACQTDDIQKNAALCYPVRK